MEDPANKLNMTQNLTIEGDVKEQVYKLKKKICEDLIREEISINKEIRYLEESKISMDQIQSEDEEIQLGGISLTSIMVYLNEIEQIDEKNRDSSQMSH